MMQKLTYIQQSESGVWYVIRRRDESPLYDRDTRKAARLVQQQYEQEHDYEQLLEVL